MNKLAMKFKLLLAKAILPFVNIYIKLEDKKRKPLENVEILATSARIIITVIGGKPYYEIKYFDLEDKEWYIGYSSYKLKNVVEWRKKCFKVVKGEIF